jgi:hypothetical protein
VPQAPSNDSSAHLVEGAVALEPGQKKIKRFEEMEKNENKRRIMIVDTPYLLG